MNGRVVVAVRVRPINSKEREADAESVIQIDGNQILVSSPKDSKSTRRKDAAEKKIFAFDHAYDSTNADSMAYAGQERLYLDLGVGLLEKTFAGYNSCIFAYGQTGSGKSYTMTGTNAPGDQGIIPTICAQLFARIAEEPSAAMSCSVEVSYLEIYAEKVRDLLSSNNKFHLRVREHPVTGPYVEDLVRLATSNYAQVQQLLSEGNARRSVARTNMNEASSRSHAVFSLILTQRQHLAGLDTEKVSKISLVDLAGSESVAKSGATGVRLKEGAEINRSLSTLGRVISALAERDSSSPQSAMVRKTVVPYRDSVLTWLLKDSLGGNSLTTMIATISPVATNYEETLSTLRYADSAKRIQNHAMINEDHNLKMIKELQAELTFLRAKMTSTGISNPTSSLDDQCVPIIAPDGSTQYISKQEIADRMEQNSKLMQEMNLTWEQKLATTKRVQLEREQALADLGIQIDNLNPIGLTTPRKIPHLINLSEDPLLDELLIYTLKPGITRCGNLASSAEIKLSAPSVLKDHCVFRNVDGIVTIESLPEAVVVVNGQRIQKVERLRSSQRIIIGEEALHVFRFNHPEEVRAERMDLLGSHPTSPTPTAPGRAKVSFSTPSRKSRINATCSLSPKLEKLHSETLQSPTTFVECGGRFEIDDTRKVTRSNTSTSSVAALVHRPELPSSLDLTSNELQTGEAQHLLQTLNAERIMAEARGMTKHSSLIARLSAAQDEAVRQFRGKSSCEKLQARQTDLMKKVFKAFRAHNEIKLTTTICKNTLLLCKGQQLAKKIHSGLDLQFIVLPTSLSISPLEDDRVHEHFSSDFALSKEERSRLAVRVMDWDRGSVVFWSLARLRRKVDSLDSMLGCRMSSTDKSRAPGAFALREKPFQRYTLIGQALLALPCPHQTVQKREFLLDVWSPYTHTVHGLLGLQIEMRPPSDGNKIVINLRLSSLSGVSKREFTEIHIHARFQNQVETCFTTKEISGFGEAPLSLNEAYSCALPAQYFPDILCFAVYGMTQHNLFLYRLRAWDELQESQAIQALPSSDQSSHPLLTKFQIMELDSDGVYRACEAVTTNEHDSGIFFLHQGLSRRIQVEFTHYNGQRNQISKVSGIHICDIKILDTKTGTQTYDADAVANPLRILSSGTTMENDVLQELVQVVAQWDSSIHNSKCLDQITPPDRIISMTVRTACHDIFDAVFNIQHAVQIRLYGREQQIGYLSRFFAHNVSPIVTRLSVLPWLVEAAPPTIESRLRTLRTQLRDQGELEDWQPRGISLIETYLNMEKRQCMSLAKQHTQLTYTTHQLSVQHMYPANPGLLENVLQIWPKSSMTCTGAHLAAQALKQLDTLCMFPRTDSIELPEKILISGPLLFRNETDGTEWSRYHFTIRGPFLCSYESTSYNNPLSVLNLRNCSIQAAHGTDSSSEPPHPGDFVVIFPLFRVRYRATSQEQRTSWCTVINSSSGMC